MAARIASAGNASPVGPAARRGVVPTATSRTSPGALTDGLGDGAVPGAAWPYRCAPGGRAAGVARGPAVVGGSDGSVVPSTDGTVPSC